MPYLPEDSCAVSLSLSQAVVIIWLLARAVGAEVMLQLNRTDQLVRLLGSEGCPRP